MSMKMKIISTLALTTAFTFASSTALAAEVISHGASVPVAHSHVVMNNNVAGPSQGLSGQQMQYHVLNNEIGYISDSQTGRGLLGNRIRVTGLMNVGGFAQQNRGFLIYWPLAENGKPKSNQNAINYSGRLFFLADANNWIHATLGFFYAGTKDPIGLSGNAFTSSRYYGQGYTYYIRGGAVGGSTQGAQTGNNPGGDLSFDGVEVDQAFVDIKDFNKTPVAIRIGRAYAPFGTYDLNAALPTFAQIIATTRADLVQVAYSGKMGLYGAVYAFNGLNKRAKVNPTTSFSPEHYVNPLSNSDDEIENGGIEVGYHGMVNNYGTFHYNVVGGYIFNLLDSNAFYRYLQSSGYTDRVGGWNVHGDLLFGAFGLTVNYVSAAEDIEKTDFARISDGATGGGNVARRAKPAAGNVYASYHFMTYGHRSTLKAGYEWTSEAALFSGVKVINQQVAEQAFALPDDRYAVQYNVDILPNTTFGIGFDYEDAYAVTDGETGNHSTNEWARLTVAM
ncbi:MAG: LbtU family siderophore porin [Gammaproteobacteria bacterium]|nr:LbtU family siderophore porin [Gammaproteobacteria bacterium]